MSFYKSRSDRGYRGGGGGFRGNRGGGDSWRGGGGRGSSFGSSRGGMSGSSRYFNSSPSTYESRPSRTYGGPSDRFASKPRDDYGSSTSFSRESDYGRVDDHRRPSPEPPRKRGRSDMSPTYPGARRSHERSYSSSDYTGRSGGYDDKGPGGGYLTEKGSYREVRESKPDYEFRKPMNKFSPRGGRSRGRSSLRSSYRGVSFRGSSRGRGFKGTTSLLARRRMESLGVRKRGGRYEYPRRPYYYRKRFAGSRMKKSDDEEDDDEMAEDDLDDEEVMDEEVDEEDETEETDEGNVDNADDEEDGPAEEDEGDGEETEVKEGEPVIKKEDDVIAEIKKEEDETSGENKKDVAVPVKKKSVVKKKAVVKKVVKKAAEDKSKTEEIGEEDKPDDGEEGEIVEEKDKEMVNARGQPFIRLTCPHCKVGCVTFREYSFHLSSRKHAISMKNLSVKLRSKLTAMRVSQRKKQRVLDSDAKSNNLRLKTFFCQVCKLNYRTLKSEHCASVEHKKMKEFLMPSCRICMLTFKSPWAYENHISDIAHFRRKARAVEKKNTTKETIDLDPSSFMVLDAVGSGDEDEESEKSEVEGETKEGEVAKEKENSAEKKKKKKDEIKLGADYCKLLEVYWCELCKIYLPRMEDREKSLTLHCRSRTHLQRFVRYRGDQTLRKRAVRLHKELEKEREKEKELLKKRAKKEGDTDDGEPRKEEEKVWNEMEQNISDILTDDPQEGGPEDEGNAEDEPEDDDSRQESERYDRFKQSEKEAKANGLSTDEIVKIDPVKDQK